MNIKAARQNNIVSGEITITGSKSETNRLLLLQALYPDLRISNASNSDDAQAMAKGLKAENKATVNIHHAGTAMRFLTAYFAANPNKEVVLTGSERMQERPIKILVDALRQLGADIIYLKEDGYPPLSIKGKALNKNKVSLNANISSQYISALLLIAPKLSNGLQLTLEGKITSVPYINMTLSLLQEIGVTTSFSDNKISISPLKNISKPITITVESDWSSASYFYSILALSGVGSQVTLSSYKPNSLQGDAVLSKIYKQFGVETVFNRNTITLKKQHNNMPELINLDLANAPDIAQTIAVTCFGLGIKCYLKGLHTLKIKETDRLEALKAELSKLGAQVKTTASELYLEASNKINENIAIATYNDHRMAMAFAPLALKVPIIINDAEVVTKSYPNFWNDLKQLSFTISEL